MFSIRPTHKIAVFSLLLLLIVSQSSYAHKTPGYSHDGGVKTSNPDWMSRLRDSVRISELSIPGTHDTMAFYGGDIARAQRMSLANQLESGIRVIDIRCRHIDDVFAIHHGQIFQKVFFGDVLNIVVEFLKKHPRETVLMRVKQEYTPSNNKKTFEQVFHDKYWTEYSASFWTAANSDNPTLGEVRGKIVVLQDFSASEKYGIDYDSFSIQDDYKLNSNFHLYGKWEKVKAFLGKANDGSEDTTFMNYLSAATNADKPIPVVVLPYFVASGHSSPGTSAPRLATGRTTPGWKSWRDFPRLDCVPVVHICTIAFEGTNVLTYERVGKSYKKRVGIVMADFPGPGLIKRIIELNNKFK